MKLLNAGCGTHYAEGWVNTDVWESDTTKPDIKVGPGEPYPFEENTFDAVFLGHVLEHIDWTLVPPFMDDISRIVKPDAPILIVGPDVYKTINRWHNGHEPWHMVESVLEHQDINWQPEREHEWWDGATHHWNCHAGRVGSLLERMDFKEVQDISDKIPDGNRWNDPAVKGLTWPIIGMARWQFAIRCLNRDWGYGSLS